MKGFGFSSPGALVLGPSSHGVDEDFKCWNKMGYTGHERVFKCSELDGVCATVDSGV